MEALVLTRRERACIDALTRGIARATLRPIAAVRISSRMRNRRLHLLCAVHRGGAWIVFALWFAACLLAHEGMVP
ncbi:MAG TPA: hypothetical protein VL463_20800 [Kofleriaceae bacterium]|nr:hypothetical protein [Kofleriaceae bacterium]